MAKALIYSFKALNTATIDAQAGTITDLSRIHDQSIGSAISSFDLNDVIRINFGSAKTATAAALYFNAAETDDIQIHGGNNADMSGAVLLHTFTTFSSGWNAASWSNSTGYQYYFLKASSGSITGLCEAVLGSKYDFEMQWTSGGEMGEDYSGVKVNESAGGQEYATKLHESKTSWSNQWNGLSSSQKTNLETVRDNTDGPFLKFIYSESGTTGPLHWVRMSADSFRFRNNGGNRFSTSIKIREQLD